MNNFNPEKILSMKTIYKLTTRYSWINNTENLINLIKNQQECLLNFDKEIDFINEILEIINVYNKNKSTNTNFDNNLNDDIILNQDNNFNDRMIKKMKNKEKIVKSFSCKKPIYENCRMYSPDDELLCYCDVIKMNWYLQRNLADIKTEDPPSFKLKFEPNSKGCKDLGDVPSDFYITFRKNCCVVCGNEKNYMRFHVVPILYRQHFPEELKSHKSHDVVLLCFPCHEEQIKFMTFKKEKFQLNLTYL